MRKIVLILMSVLFVFSLCACNATRIDKRAERHKDSVAESRVRDRRKLKQQGQGQGQGQGQSEGQEQPKEQTQEQSEVTSEQSKEAVADNSKANEVANNGENIVLRLAEVHATGYPTTMADEKFAQLVSEATNGRITIEVYSDGKLGDETAVIEAMQKGEIDFARVSISPMSEYSPELNALSLPYLYRDAEHMWNVLNGHLGQQMLDSIINAQLIGLAWYDSGSRNFFANKKIESFEDFDGLRVRMQNNDLMFDLAESLGCEPVNMSMGDINPSIEQNILDGAENNIPTYESYNHVIYAPYYILDSHSRIPEILAGSQIVFESLSPEDQKIIKECAKETQEYEILEWEKREVEAKEKVEEQGAEIIELSDDVMEEIRKACEPLYKKHAGDYMDIVEEIQGMA